jgi:hypothetical protein
LQECGMNKVNETRIKTTTALWFYYRCHSNEYVRTFPSYLQATEMDKRCWGWMIKTLLLKLETKFQANLIDGSVSLGSRTKRIFSMTLEAGFWHGLEDQAKNYLGKFGLLDTCYLRDICWRLRVCGKVRQG